MFLCFLFGAFMDREKKKVTIVGLPQRRELEEKYGFKKLRLKLEEKYEFKKLPDIALPALETHNIPLQDKKVVQSPKDKEIDQEVASYFPNGERVVWGVGLLSPPKILRKTWGLKAFSKTGELSLDLNFGDEASSEEEEFGASMASEGCLNSGNIHAWMSNFIAKEEKESGASMASEGFCTSSDDSNSPNSTFDSPKVGKRKSAANARECKPNKRSKVSKNL